MVGRIESKYGEYRRSKVIQMTQVDLFYLEGFVEYFVAQMSNLTSISHHVDSFHYDSFLPAGYGYLAVLASLT